MTQPRNWTQQGGLALILSMLCIPNLGWANPTSQRPHAFQNFTSDQGLSNNSAFHILQDSQGFMWFGTSKGLNRFDGYTFRTYTHHPEDPHSLSNSNITHLWEDQDGSLWVGTYNGLNHFDPQTESFEQIPISTTSSPPQTEQTIVYCFMRDTDGCAWIGSSQGLFYLDSDKTLHASPPPNAIHTTYEVTALHQDSQIANILWVGTSQGLYCWDTKRHIWIDHPISNTRESDQKHLHILSLTQDRENTLWLGTLSGLYQFNQQKQNAVLISRHSDNGFSIPSVPIDALCLDEQGDLWMGTRGHGLYILHPSTGHLHHCTHNRNDPRSLSWDVITSICPDRSGSIWIGTYGRGINLWHPVLERFRAYVNQPHNTQSLSIESVLSTIEDRDGYLWIAGYGGTSLDIFDPKTGCCEHIGQTITHGNGDIRVISADKISQGAHIWLGIENNPTQLVLIDQSSRKTIKAYKLSPLVAGKQVLIQVIYPDKDGYLWLGTDQGLFRLTIQTEQWLTPQNINALIPALIHKPIQTLLEDFNGHLWVGTPYAGIYLIDKSNDKLTLCPPNSPSLNTSQMSPTSNILEDQKHQLWIGTRFGLHQINPQTGHIQSYTTSDGLLTNHIDWLLEDPEGRIWISSLFGLSRYSPNSISEKPFTSFHIEDGLHSNEFYSAACIMKKTGQLCFGGRNGFTIFDPSKVTSNNYTPPIVLTTLRLFNRKDPTQASPVKRSIVTQSLYTKPEIKLTQEDSIFSLEFSALNYIFTEKNQYAYRLEGLDDDWNYVGTQRFVTYSGLPPGTYTFHVKGSNNDGQWNHTGTSLRIFIPPPFWATTGFRISIILLGILLLLATYYYKTWRIRRQNVKLERIVQQRTHELDKAKVKAEEASKAKTQFLTRIRELSRELTEAQEKERTRIAYQLHESIAQDLCAIKCGLETQANNPNTPPQTIHDKAVKYADMLFNVVNSIRDLSYELRPPALGQLGLIRAIEIECQEFHQQTKIDVTLDTSNFTSQDQEELRSETSIILYRMIQEGLHNINQHAQATQAHITLKRTHQGLSLIIHDNGHGLSPKPADKSGLGLDSIHHRVHLLGGEVTISSSPQTGTTLIIAIPLQAEESPTSG